MIRIGRSIKVVTAPLENASASKALRDALQTRRRKNDQSTVGASVGGMTDVGQKGGDLRP